MERLTTVRTDPPIYDKRYKFICPIESDCGAFEEANYTCFECGVHKHIAKLAAYEDAEKQKRLIILPKEDHQPMFVKYDAIDTFDKWNDTTGAIANGTSWYYEAQAVIEEIAAMAFGAGIFYQAEKESEAQKALEGMK